MSFLPDFSKLEEYLTKFDAFLLAAAGSLDLLHTKVDAVTADVATIKETSANPVSLVNTVSAVSDIQAQGAEILAAVKSVTDTVKSIASAAPTQEAPKAE